MEAASRHASGRTKHELLPEKAFPNDRYHYSLLGFLQKRRGGGGSSHSSSSGGSRSSGSSSGGSSKGSSGSSSSGSSSKPATPKSGSSTSGSSPSKPKPFNVAPPKIPKIPKIPKLPKPGWKPPKGFLPGYTPGHPPHHGSGGHSPVIGGGHGHDNDHASPARSCIHPKGMDRLRCEKADAVVGTLFAIIALLLVPFLIYMCIRYWKRRKGARKDRDEEDGMELTRGGTDYYSGPQTDRGVPDGASNIGLAITTSQKSITLTKEQTQDRSSGSSPGRVPPPAYHPSTRSVSRGQEHSLYQPSERSVRSSFSSGMIRTASSGQALQDAKIVDLPPSLAGSRRESERRYSSSDVDRSSGSSTHADGEQHCSEEGGDCADNVVDSGETQKEADRRSRSFSRESCSRTSDQQNGEAGRPDEEVERRSRSSSRRSCSPVSEHHNEQEGRPDNAGSRCSCRRSSSHDHNDQHEEGEEGYVTAASETGSLG